MFILQKQLSVLNVPSHRVAMLYRSSADIQLALPDLPSQLAAAFLVMLKGGGKGQVLVSLYMTKSNQNLLYISDSGEVDAEHIDQELEAGLDFIESMGFTLNDVEFNRMTAEQQEDYWKALPLCSLPEHEEPAVPSGTNPDKGNADTSSSPETPVNETVPAVTSASKKTTDVAAPLTSATAQGNTRVVRSVPLKTSLESKRNLLKEHLGRFLASL